MVLRNNKGFTLIEIIIAIVLTAVLGTFSIGFLTNIMQATQLTSGKKNLVDEAKLAMEFLVRELRFADGQTPIRCIPVGCNASTMITFNKLFGYTEDGGTTFGIVYAFDALTGTLKRTSGTTTTTLANNVTDFSVTLSTTPANFYIIKITLQGSLGEEFSLESAARPRSLI